MKRKIMTLVLAAALLLAGCSDMSAAQTDATVMPTVAQENTTESAAATQATQAAATKAPAATTAATTTAATSAETTSSTTAATSAETTGIMEILYPLTENKSGKVQIQTISGDPQHLYISYAITSAEGETIIVDPRVMPAKDMADLNPAAIVTTNDHPEHCDKAYSDSYDCQKILYVRADISTKDFHIYSIPSARQGRTVYENANSEIIIIEVDGLRIADFGDIGQKELTSDQLEQLGDIDIAFMQFENEFTQMSLENEKGFNLMKQLNPKIIIPTHYTDAAIPVFEQKYGDISIFENVLSISKDDLPAGTPVLYRITNTHYYGEEFLAAHAND